MNPPERLSTIDVPDVQARIPATQVSLSRVGVTGVEKIVRISANGDEQLYHAALECFVDLNPQQTGVHMSRFEEVVNEAIEHVVIGEAFTAETLASHIAERVRQRQGGLRAEVTIKARYPEHKLTPVSGVKTQELYTLIGIAVSSERGLRRLVGVQAQGMTACPCAQELIAGSARERLVEQGFTEDEIDRVFEAVPVATHNQRGVGTLYVGCPEGCVAELRAETLLSIVEGSMSSEIFELMKRSDEQAVVEKAHRRPRFVEDCVREMIKGVVSSLPVLDDEAFVLARQENLETIHQHNVVAERYGLVSELRGELESGTHLRRHVTMREWLESPCA
jgi:GTP cyclohydrolase I/GTP cyclohydrolase-4